MPVSNGVAAVSALLRRHDGVEPLLIGVDGCGAAGKSTFAAALVAHVGGVVVDLGDFYRPMEPDRRRGLDAQTGYELYVDWQRLIAEVLDPLLLGEVAVYRRYDAASDEVGEDVALVEPRGVVVFDGLYAHRPQLRGYWDIAVWVQAPADVCSARPVATEHTHRWADGWAASEAWYVANVDPRSHADVVVDGA